MGLQNHRHPERRHNRMAAYAPRAGTDPDLSGKNDKVHRLIKL